MLLAHLFPCECSFFNNEVHYVETGVMCTAMESFCGNSLRYNNHGGRWIRCKLLARLDSNIDVLKSLIMWILQLQISSGNVGRRKCKVTLLLLKELELCNGYYLIFWQGSKVKTKLWRDHGFFKATTESYIESKHPESNSVWAGTTIIGLKKKMTKWWWDHSCMLCLCCACSRRVIPHVLFTTCKKRRMQKEKKKEKKIILSMVKKSLRLNFHLLYGIQSSK